VTEDELQQQGEDASKGKWLRRLLMWLEWLLIAIALEAILIFWWPMS